MNKHFFYKERDKRQYTHTDYVKYNHGITMRDSVYIVLYVLEQKR